MGVRFWFRGLDRYRSALPLHLMLIIPFVGITVGTAALVGYLSYRSGQQAVVALANQLMDETSDRVTSEVQTYLQTPMLINRLNVDAAQGQQIDLQNSAELEALLFLRLQQFDQVSAVLFANPEGWLRTVERDSQGSRSQQIEHLEQIDVQEHFWYQRAVRSGQPGWNPIFQQGSAAALTLNASQPVYNRATNRLEGVFAVRIRLDYLCLMLRRLSARHSGQILILDQQQKMIATSGPELPYRIEPSHGDRRQLRRISLQDSDDPLTRSVASALRDRAIHFTPFEQRFSFDYGGEQRFVQIVPFQDAAGLDWHILTIVPESDFMSEINASRQITAVLSLLALGMAIGAGLTIANRLSRRIAHLNRASQQLAAGNLTQPLPTDSPIAEIQGLSQSFNQMAAHLQQSFERIRTALAESEEKFTSIFRTNPEPMAIVSFASGHILDLNESMAEFFGDSRTDLIGRTIAELGLWHEPGSQQQFEQQLQQGKVRHLETTVRTRFGSLRTVLITADLRELDGQMCVIQGMTDITDRKQTEARLHRTEQWLRQYSRQSPSAIYTHVQHPDGRTWLEYISEAIEAIHEVSQAQALADCSFLLDQIDPDDRAGYSTAMERSAHALEQFSHEWRIVTPAGRLKWLRALSQPEQRSNGAIAWYGVVQDITDLKRSEADRKQAELALRQSEERYRCLVEITPQMIWTANAAGEDNYFSQQLCQYVGLPPEQMLGLRWKNVVHPDEVDRVYDRWWQAISAGMPYEDEFRIRRADGVYRWQLVRALPLSNEQGEIVQWFGMSTDISDRKQAELALQQAKEAAEAANLAKSTFLANMSHELRTPLNVILGYTQLLDYTSALAPEHQSYLRSILRSGNQLLDLINDVLDLSKIEAGRQTLEPTRFNLSELLQTLGEMFRLRAEAKHLTLRLDLPSSASLPIVADLNKLRQVITNLLSNAIKFTDRGTVQLRARLKPLQDDSLSPDSFMLQIDVIDTGVGIDPAEQDSIFEAFSQASAGKLSAEGTGLGLAICRRFVQIMGGTIAVESKPGQGSCFTFWVPVQSFNPNEAIPARRDRLVVGLLPNQPQYRILVVDDQPENRQLLAQLLERIGLSVRQAADGTEAVQQWQTWRPHLIWMDLRMSNLSGYEAMQQIRALEAEEQRSRGAAQESGTGERRRNDASQRANHSRSSSQPSCPPASLPPSPPASLPTPIIALTAQAYRTDHDRALAAGFDGFVTKPFAAAAIFGQMATHLGLQYQYAENQYAGNQYAGNHHAEDQRAENQAELGAIDSAASQLLLQPADLRVMPDHWIAALHQAALNCSLQEVEPLIAQIPSHHTALIQCLQQLGYNYEFELIMQLSRSNAADDATDL